MEHVPGLCLVIAHGDGADVALVADGPGRQANRLHDPGLEGIHPYRGAAGAQDPGIQVAEGVILRAPYAQSISLLGFHDQEPPELGHGSQAGRPLLRTRPHDCLLKVGHPGGWEPLRQGGHLPQWLRWGAKNRPRVGCGRAGRRCEGRGRAARTHGGRVYVGQPAVPGVDHL